MRTLFVWRGPDGHPPHRFTVAMLARADFPRAV
jgi:hypothetical protein